MGIDEALALVTGTNDCAGEVALTDRTSEFTGHDTGARLPGIFPGEPLSVAPAFGQTVGRTLPNIPPWTTSLIN